jgi:hypothetical protein
MTGSTGALLLSGLLAACVTRSAYDQLNQQLSSEIARVSSTSPGFRER